MTERKAPAPDDSAAIQRTADRIIRQVGDLLLKHGELSAWAVHKPPGSDWVDAPTEQKIGKWFHFGCYGNGCYYVWPHSIDWESNPVRLFDGICQSLTAILSRQSPRLPDELADWIRGDPTDAMARWVWFASGYATTPLRDTPRTRRKCWGNDGVSYFDADRLEFQRSSLPEMLRERMPPNADCWLVEIKNLLQTTIDAVEYLAELSYETSDTIGTVATGGETIAEAEPVAVPKLTIPQCADVPPNERTFDHLFFEVSCAERDDSIADEKDSKGHWRGAHQLRQFSERRRADYPKWPGVERLRLEIESTGDAFNRAALVKWRARQCLAVGIDTDTLNATKLGDIATGLENPRSGKTEATQPEADSVPVVDAISGTEKTRADKLTSLAPCERKAYLLHTYAETKNERRLNDREAWEYLNEHGVGDDGDELKQHELPLVDTYADYMNRARRKLGEKKYTPRGGRANGSRSVQKPPEI